VLEQLAEDYPLPKLLLEHRSLAKLKSTYTDKLPRWSTRHRPRAHQLQPRPWPSPAGSPAPSPTCRTSPSARRRPPHPRRLHRAGGVTSIVSADYSQIELRIMAHLSGDKGLLEAFAAGEDVHRATAGEVFGVGAGGGDAASSAATPR
jgi:DNA polymerase-1